MTGNVVATLLVYFASSTLNMTWRRKFAKTTKLSSLTVTTLTLAVFVWPLSTLFSNILPLPQQATQLSLTFWFSCLAAALCQVASSSLGFSSLRYTDVSDYNLLSQIYTPISIVLAIVFLSEGLTITQAIGACLLIAGAMVVLKGDKTRFALTKGNILALLCGAFLGVGVVTTRIAVRLGGLPNYTKYGYMMQVSILLVITSKIIYKERAEISNSLRDVTIMGLGRFGQLFSFVLATVYASNLALVSSVTTFNVVLIFGAGYFFLKERKNLKQKLLGVSLAMLGLLMSI